MSTWGRKGVRFTKSLHVLMINYNVIMEMSNYYDYSLTTFNEYIAWNRVWVMTAHEGLAPMWGDVRAGIMEIFCFMTT